MKNDRLLYRLEGVLNDRLSWIISSTHTSIHGSGCYSSTVHADLPHLQNSSDTHRVISTCYTKSHEVYIKIGVGCCGFFKCMSLPLSLSSSPPSPSPPSPSRHHRHHHRHHHRPHPSPCYLVPLRRTQEDWQPGTSRREGHKTVDSRTQTGSALHEPPATTTKSRSLKTECTAFHRFSSFCNVKTIKNHWKSRNRW